MPKTPINYENTIIYKLVCKDVSIIDCYVGHTTDFIRRKQQHKNCCNNQNNRMYCGRVYEFIRNNGGWDCFDMVMIETYPCKNVYEAHSRERHWIETLNAKLNISIPTRTRQEYYEDNKSKVLEYHKKYYEENKNKVLESQKKYTEENRNKILAYKKLYREKNAEKIKKPNACDCGGHYTNEHKTRHFKSIMHQNFLKQQN
jgi:hypothetical protein